MRLQPAFHDLVEAVEEVLSDGTARTVDEVIDALLDRGIDLGDDAEELVLEVLDDDQLPLVMPLFDGTYVDQAALLQGRTFTHRVTEAEVERDYVAMSPDFEPLSLLTDHPSYGRMTDGSLVEEAFPGLDDEVLAERRIELSESELSAWLLDEDTMRRIGAQAGDLVGVTLRSDGFEVVLVAAPDLETADLGAQLTAILDAYADGHPAQIFEVVWQVCADDPHRFAVPGPPLVEIFDAAGLDWDGELVAPRGLDIGQWEVSRQLAEIQALYRLRTDEAEAVIALLGVHQQLVDGDTPDLSGVALDPLSRPAVAESFAAMTMELYDEGAAVVARLAELLEPLAPRSARANVRWLRGKALERLGDALGAEAAYEAALDLDSDCLLPLLDLAGVARDRGDAERGLSLLRRAGIPSDDDLVVLLEHLRPVERTDIGRNDRCWCGSGRKYKVCHRNREALPLEDRALWLYQKAVVHLGEGPGRLEVLDLSDIRTQHWSVPDALLGGMRDPLVIDAALFEGEQFQAFVDQRGVLLPADELLLAQQWLLSDRSVHEIEAVSPGESFTVRDVRTGDRLEVRERTASQVLQTGALVCARLVPVGDGVQCFGGLEPVALHQRDDLLALLDEAPTAAELVEFLSRRFAPPVLQNTHGDPLVFCEAAVRVRDTAGLIEHLDSDYERLDDEAQVWHAVEEPGDVARIIATMTLEGDELLVETNSTRRLDDVLADLTIALGELDVVRRDLTPAAGSTDGSSSSPVPITPEVAQLMADVIRQHELAWLDESIPALSGITPREAAADPTRRPDLVRLLDGFPDVGPDDLTMMSAHRLRVDLGL